MKKHYIGITMGDPAGVGPEVICKALATMDAKQRAAIRLFGSRSTLEAASSIVGANLDFSNDGRDVFVDDVVPRTALPFGRMDPAAGDASFRYVERAVRAALADEIGVIVTAPINKEALNAAGHHYDGHTGMLAALTGAKSSFMLLTSEHMSVIHVSTHVSLQNAIKRATTERILETVRVGDAHMKRVGKQSPRIAVAGINPHCGEGGLFGTEDDQQVAPAVALARAEGIDVVGPVPADTVYHRAHNGAFDLVVAQYHDQGHIPMKLVAFDTTVNVSLGLPIDRTSVDHGTAFDIAGTGRANHVNMLAAIDYAKTLVTQRNA